MSKQARRIYQTGDPNLDMILMDIAARLDVMEGLRPDLAAGYIKIESDKDIDTSDIDTELTEYQKTVTGISLTDNTMVLTESTISVVDENGTTIHKME